MNNRIGIYAAILLVVVLVSGCTQTNQSKTTSVNDGLVINELSVDPSVIDSSIQDTGSILLEIENVGGTTASNIVATLSGVSGLGLTSSEATKSISEMSPPDITVSPPSPGEFKVFQWEIRPDRLPEGISHPYPITARIEYGYKTTGAVTIPLYMRSEYKRRSQRGEPIDSTITVTNTNAPVKIAVTGETPFIARASGDVASYRLSFTNVGDGVPNTNNVDGLLLGTIKIVGNNAQFADCLGVKNGTEITLDANNLDRQIKLRRGSSDKRLCDIRYTGSAPSDTITLEFRLTYRYYIQREITVTVIGGNPINQS